MTDKKRLSASTFHRPSAFHRGRFTCEQKDEVKLENNKKGGKKLYFTSSIRHGRGRRNRSARSELIVSLNVFTWGAEQPCTSPSGDLTDNTHTPPQCV